MGMVGDGLWRDLRGLGSLGDGIGVMGFGFGDNRI